MKFKHILTFLALSFCTVPAFATLTGDELLKRCNDANSQNKDYNLGFCRGYVASFLDTYVLTHAVHKLPENSKLFCLPTDGIALQTAIDTATKYLGKDQQELSKSARSSLFKAFMQQYPCANTKSSVPQENIDRDI